MSDANGKFTSIQHTERYLPAPISPPSSYKESMSRKSGGCPNTKHELKILHL